MKGNVGLLDWCNAALSLVSVHSLSIAEEISIPLSFPVNYCLYKREYILYIFLLPRLIIDSEALTTYTSPQRDFYVKSK